MLLELTDVHTYYGEAHILQGVSISLKEGEVVTLIGRNGAGKTTTLRSIMGIAPPRRGRIRLRQQDITRWPTHAIVRAGIAWVPEERRVIPNLTVLENLRLGMLGAGVGVDGARRVEEVFEYFPRLRERTDHRGQLLSGGEQQMLAIARGLMARPTLLLLDEPSLGLAPIVVSEMFRAIERIRNEGMTLMIVEQNVQQTLQVADRAYVLENGSIALEGRGADLLDDPHMKAAYLGAE